MDLTTLTRQEIITLRNKCNRTLQLFDEREKCEIYVISDTEADSQYCFKKHEGAISKLREMLDKELECHELFSKHSKTILTITLIDKVEYDNQPDSWEYI
jgi:hypothetical protein